MLLFALRRPAEVRGKSVLITGGSKGLGLLLAREFGRLGGRVVITARNDTELWLARSRLSRWGVDVETRAVDVRDRAAMRALIEELEAREGSIDYLVNNAGVIQVGPVAALDVSDFEAALETMFWGVVTPTLAAVEGMKRRRNGRIVNVTSVGGKVSFPHLLPYNAAKFAAVGFSEGLRAELASHGVGVVTVVPGLMRTVPSSTPSSAVTSPASCGGLRSALRCRSSRSAPSTPPAASSKRRDTTRRS